MSESDSFKMVSDQYYLLKIYARESKILSYAYSLSESYYRNLYKYFNYPLVILSASSTVLSGMNENTYIIMGISLSMLILIGFDKLIDPKDREHKANQFKVEYGEINSNIKLFILNNGKVSHEIKAYASQIHEMMNKWQSINPPVFSKFIKLSTIKYTKKIRNHTILCEEKKTTPRGSTEQLNTIPDV